MVLLKSLMLWAVLGEFTCDQVMSSECCCAFKIMSNQVMLVCDILVAVVAFCGDGGRGRVLFLKSLMLRALLGELFT